MARRTRSELTEVEALRAELERVRAERDAALAGRRVRLTDQQRRRIIQLLRKGGMSDRAIAREVDVHPTTVGKLRRSLPPTGK